MSIKVLVADDHEVVRSGLHTLFKGSDIQIVGEASDSDQVVKEALKQKPDVLVMDIRLGDSDGLDALERIRAKSPDQRVVVLSTYDNPTYVARPVALGANDYVLKGSTRAEIISAIKRAAAGESPAADSIMNRVRSAMSRKRNDDDKIPLTNRELQVLRHVALGLSNREIGRSLGISLETVKEHVQNMRRKIDVPARTQAAVWAVKKGIVLDD
jgi:DNA-binding NarL/FixJ family response regulator